MTLKNKIDRIHVLNLYFSQKKTGVEIAKIVGCTPPNVYHIIRDYQFTNGIVKPTKVEKDIDRLYKSGLTYLEISKKMNLSYSRVGNIIRAFKERSVNQEIQNSDVDQIIDDMRSMDIVAINKKHGISVDAIKVIARENGLTILVQKTEPKISQSEAIYNDYVAGMSYFRMMKKYGLKYQSIAVSLTRYRRKLVAQGIKPKYMYE